MLKTLWRASKWLFRATWNNCKWYLLLTLPLTILPSISGVVYGFYFARWHNDRVMENVHAYLHDLKDYASDWGVPGMTFRQYQDTHNDFHLMRLNTNDWNSKLGFILPREYGDRKYRARTPVNKYASLDALMLDTTVLAGPTPPKEQWVYISGFAFPGFNPSDTAFDSAVQSAYVPSTLNKTRIFFVTCYGTAGFLCGAWGVRQATLLHFFVEDSPPRPDGITSQLTYSTELCNLRPVTVRVIEFPLQGHHTGLPFNVFPGLREQMLAIMHGDRLFEQFEPWDEAYQAVRRFDEHMVELYHRKGTFFYYLWKAEGWAMSHLAKPLFVEDSLQIVRTCWLIGSTVTTQFLILTPWHWAKKTVLEYLGYPKLGDWVFGNSWEKKRNPWNGLFGDMMSAFWESVGKRLKEAEVENLWPEGKITTGPTPGATTTSTALSAKTLF
jgi:hypothetical protein